MFQKKTLILVFVVVLLLGFSSTVLAGNPASSAYQVMSTAMATPVPLVTPQASSGTYMDSTNTANCPMMGGMAGMGTMAGAGTNMGNMGSMGGMMMSGTTMQGTNMQGMSNMPYMSDRYVILSDPTTWINANPWTLLGWIAVFLVLLALLAGLGLGVFWFARRIAAPRPTAKS